MKNIKRLFWLILIVLSAIWLAADTLLPAPFTYFSFRSVFVQYTGVLGIGMMSLALYLAVRPKWIERPLRGLDKMYRLHKWLGIGGLVVFVLHWWWAKGTKWMVGWGWLERPQHRSHAGEAMPAMEHWLRGQRGIAESVGEWAFYAVVILILLALIKSFPYHLFKKTHKWLAVAYPVLVYHTLVLAKFDYWSQPVGWAIAVMLIVGTVSSLLILTGRVGRSRTVAGVIQSLTPYPELRVIEGCVRLDDGWRGHMPGQFAFVTSKRSEGAHPYTIASSWEPGASNLTFIVKDLGDWTGQLKQWLKVDMSVTVEGPYGCFDFSDDLPRQIWVGAGIGITPFIARMKHLARFPGEQEIDLFLATKEVDPAAIEKLTADAKAANVRLHITITPKDGRLSPERIRQEVPEWGDASIWFCGPAEFGKSLRKDFAQQGMPTARFHQELFAMR